MADERRRPSGNFDKAPGSGARPGNTMPSRTITAAGGVRAPRAAVVVPVRCKFESILDFVETQSVNISKSGMFLTTSESVPLGTLLELEVGLNDGLALLKGKAEVVRVSTSAPAGLGVRFVELDNASQKLVDRIVEVNQQEGKRPTVPMDFALDGGRQSGAAGGNTVAAGVNWKESALELELNAGTVSYFVYNPLLNIRLGGFVVPAEKEVPLGTVFTVSIRTAAGDALFDGKGKVVAKHEKRLGIRLTEVDKTVLARLQAEVSKLASASK
jgi:uncharacterized protein (TIGR02266 family)